MTGIEFLVGAGIAAAKGAVALAGKGISAAASKVGGLFSGSSAKLALGAAAGGVSAASAQAQANAQKRAAIQALNENQEALKVKQQLMQREERIAALQFRRKAAVAAGNTLASSVSLGGVGQSGDILSALASSQFIEAEAENLNAESRFSALRIQSQNIFNQATSLRDSIRSPLLAGITGGLAAGLRGAANLPSKTNPLGTKLGATMLSAANDLPVLRNLEPPVPTRAGLFGTRIEPFDTDFNSSMIGRA